MQCNQYKYVHLESSSFKKLDFPIKTTGSTPEWTIEFWVFFQKGVLLGDIVTVKMQDQTMIRYKEDSTTSSKIEYQLYPLGVLTPSFTEIAFDRPTQIDFKKTYWKKFILIYSDSSSTFYVKLDNL